MRCPGLSLLLGVTLAGCGGPREHRERPQDTAREDSDPRDTPPWDSAPGDTAPDSPADTAPEHVPPEGEQDLEAAAGFSANMYCDWIYLGEFTGDDIPDYVMDGFDVIAGPLPPVLDLEDDDAVTARFDFKEDFWVDSVGTGRFETDGYSDLVYAGAYADTGGGGWYGAATYVYHGPLLYDRVIGDTTPGYEADATLLYYGELEQRVGWSSSLGDTNGDGLDELLLGSPAVYSNVYPCADDAVYLFQGPIDGTHDVAEADTIFLDPAGYRGLGVEVDLHGDFDGDGLKDPVLVAYEFYNDDGVFVFSGPSPTGVIDAGSADAILSPLRVSYMDFTTGDQGGDGYDDLVVADAGAGGGGLIRIFNGPLPVAFTLNDWQVLIHHSQDLAEFGNSASLEQDLDADGRDDLVAAAPHASNWAWTGGAYVFYGPLAGSLDADDADTVYRVWTGDNPLKVQGPAGVAPGGDVNLDGYEDFFSTGCCCEDVLSCNLRIFGVFGGVR